MGEQVSRTIWGCWGRELDYSVIFSTWNERILCANADTKLRIWGFSLVNSILRSVILSWATLGKVSWTLPHRDMYNRHIGMFTSEYFKFCGTVQRAGIGVILNKGESLPGQLLPSYLQYFLVLWWAGCCYISYSKVEEKKNSTNMCNSILVFGRRIKMLAGKHMLMKCWKTTHHSLHYLPCFQARHNYGLTISANLVTTLMPVAQRIHISHFPNTRHFYMFSISITTPTSTARLDTR